MAKTSPTQRALAECKRLGWKAAIVERWNQWARVRQDLFGFADLVVLDGAPGLLALQVTDATSISKRMEKLSGVALVVDWLKAGMRVEVWGWRKLVVKRGGKATRWTLRRVAARLASDGVGISWDELGDGAGPLVDDLLDKADELDALRDAIRGAWVDHASNEGVECCGAAFAGLDGAKECVVAKRFMDALDQRGLSGPVGGQ